MHLRKLRKKNVVALAEGLTLGHPDDVVVDPGQHRIAAVVLHEGKVPEVSVVCRADVVHGFAGDVLGIDGLPPIHLAYQSPDILKLLEDGIRLRGRHVLSDEGVDLGRIVGIMVDEGGNVTEYHVRDGILGWFRRARRIRPYQLATVGEDVAVTKTP